ncbi:monocarboxylate transporter 9-like [Musca vetustissima]|uniref:monocarboxylate transporter 9-like n=1 Tax=Musca vetustissima TaxID=27455 RepID=UPI002AB733CF|nr:monocarboxylate transporter 9-like [Musca vetustissima]
MAKDKSEPVNKTKDSNGTIKTKIPKRRDKSDLGPNFIAPDGGWGWVVCIAAGLSNFSVLPALQQYGLIYRQRMTSFGFESKETTAIFNVAMALSSLVGLVNGAMFRRFTFRQVGMVGGILTFSGILFSAFCTTFTEFVVFFSCIYGLGMGLSMGASALAVNTYFKKKRRRATGFSWTITGLGPIIFPQISRLALGYYGSQGCIFIFSAIALNAFLSALTFQPVLWHSAKSEDNKIVKSEEDEKGEEVQCKYCRQSENIAEKRSMFSSQYLFNEDDPETPGYEIIEPATPMMTRANDGWYGSKLSLAESRSIKDVRKNSIHNGGQRVTNLTKPNYFNREMEVANHNASNNGCQCNCAEEKAFLQIKKKEEELTKMQMQQEEETKSRMSFWQKVVVFFDFDLLTDMTFLNLAVGMTIMMFGEINFSILTPFILNSFGYSDTQISLAMSLLAIVDIAVRFLSPFVLEKVKLTNRVLFAFGIIAISIGRLIVTLTDSYNVILVVFALIGFGKGFRTIFSPLIIPSYVPLKRLPAASGLQLIFSSLAYFLLGQVLGIITDRFGYSATIHSINCLTLLSLSLWLLESLVRRCLGKKFPDDVN